MTNALSEYLGLSQTLNPTGYHGFPEYEQEEYESPFILEIQLQTEDDLKKFVELTGAESVLEDGKQTVKSIWYPKLESGERGSCAKYCWVESE